MGPPDFKRGFATVIISKVMSDKDVKRKVSCAYVISPYILLI